VRHAYVAGPGGHYARLRAAYEGARFSPGHPGNLPGEPAARGHDGKEPVMGLDDKIDNKAEEFGGKAKEGVGRATDDQELEAEGQTDQASSHVKQAGEKIKDVFKS
jgi:uncharacterized protein YjbJ (UPF0337 family)